MRNGEEKFLYLRWERLKKNRLSQDKKAVVDAGLRRCSGRGSASRSSGIPPEDRGKADGSRPVQTMVDNMWDWGGSNGMVIAASTKRNASSTTKYINGVILSIAHKLKKTNYWLFQVPQVKVKGGTARISKQ